MEVTSTDSFVQIDGSLDLPQNVISTDPKGSVDLTTPLVYASRSIIHRCMHLCYNIYMHLCYNIYMHRNQGTRYWPHAADI